MGFLDWALEQAKDAGPFIAVICLGGTSVIVRVMWGRHVRDIDDMKAIARAQVKAQEEDTIAKVKLAQAIGELSSLILARFGGVKKKRSILKKQGR